MITNEIKYEIALRVKIKKEFEWKYAYNSKTYKCVGEFTGCNGEVYYVVIDESGIGNFYDKSKFIILGEYEDRKKDSEEE